MPHHNECCVPQCSPYQTRHRFPNPGKYLERFRKWVHSINNMEINGMDPALVYSSKRVCHKHFEAMDAVPTLFFQGTQISHADAFCRLPLTSPDIEGSPFQEVLMLESVPEKSFTAERIVGKTEDRILSKV
ncbi:hypothetical protein JTB14_028184 [Gonioctena quinquepunctata]|nr:hypothetical protein JTB14_028184 [Gonioctena quinquepunctata]